MERRAWHLARQCGVESAPADQVARRLTLAPDSSHAAGVLNDAELGVTALPARGLTNREIAERLCVTVEQHLTKAHRKLKVTGRPA